MTIATDGAVAEQSPNVHDGHAPNSKRQKLHGRAFYESLGSPKFIVAPMVDQSEFAWRMLSRSFLSDDEKKKFLAYTPMLHARLFAQEEKYRRQHFQPTRPAPSSSSDSSSTTSQQQPWLDGNPKIDRPLFVQFCANDPDHLLDAAKQVAPYCDAVDLNLGCPQGIARKGHYGAFLQEDQGLIYKLINKLHRELDVPVTAKIRILDDKAETLAYARNVLSAGASILTVHGRRREQKGHMTGIADWKMIRYLRDNLPPDTVLFANGNILQEADVQLCLDATGADGVMSAEGNLSNPGVFAKPPEPGASGALANREYWRGADGRDGWRIDAVTRRYLDILHEYVLDEKPPERRPLFVPGDDTTWIEEAEKQQQQEEEAEKANGDGNSQPAKRRKKEHKPNGGKRPPAQSSPPNMTAVQPHLFHLLRHFVSRHTDIRDQLARARFDGIQGYERVLAAVELRVARGLLDYEATGGQSFEEEEMAPLLVQAGEEEETEETSSRPTIRRCKRPWWVVQPIIRPLPAEALKNGALQLKKKDRKNAEVDLVRKRKAGSEAAGERPASQIKMSCDGEQSDDRQAESAEEVLKGKQEDLAERDQLLSG